ncbi:alpha/beta hydrolase [Brucepastera parasyntrophica]|uniref:alpha/beta hydrolase n=1 Tax=Brucepastera parasyntrophica TaxID=2880008 RepID=UPI00210E5031|nr:alpha/beta hydrolase [Brucepastera parasyntrophica]ULQ60462.1 alpha/beta hydrolase [Brucepastera parasyntrophica]
MGFSLKEASALKQVTKSETPILFIHGEADTFVPFEMMDRLYNACVSEKEKYAVPGAKHGKAQLTAGKEYWDRVFAFTDKFL